jgi:flagellar basal-body rod modification protein FlgD
MAVSNVGKTPTINKNPTTSPIKDLQSSTSLKTTGNPSIDQAGFLKLLTAQMTMQDPTSPMDSNTMVQQLSQMSMVSGVTEMNTSMKALLADETGNRIGNAADWLGKSVLVAGASAQPLQDGRFAGRVALPSDATNVSISLVDGSGQPVYSTTATNHKAGSIDFSFSGKTDSGATVSGPLKVVVSAIGKSGLIKTTTATWSTVTGVESPGGGSSAKLNTTTGSFAPTDVLGLT